MSDQYGHSFLLVIAGTAFFLSHLPNSIPSKKIAAETLALGPLKKHTKLSGLKHASRPSTRRFNNKEN